METLGTSTGIFIGDLVILALILLACTPALVKLLVIIPQRSHQNLQQQRGNQLEAPFFSIHMAIHDEPPGMVIDSLKTLGKLKWPSDRLEVIVIDNNTSDPGVWKPVEKWCLGAKPGFKFIHREGVRGAKAGALNIALEATHPEADHVVTVDADYQVYSGFLTRAAQIIASGNFSHIQFPQAYRDAKESAVGAELGQYFTTYARAANRTFSMLLTGTMSVIRRDDLAEAGGWPIDTVTEDADLGARLLARGGSGIFINEIQGTGLLPTSLSCLSKQRLRWAAGNAKVLRKMFSRDGVPGKHRIAVAGQLSAWLQGAYLLLPIMFASEIFASLAHWKMPAITIFVSLFLLEALIVLTTAAGPLPMRLRASGVRFAMSGEGSRGLLGFVPSHRPAFIRTLKSSPPRVRCAPCEVFPPLLMILLFAFSIHQELPAFAVITAVLALRFTARVLLSGNMFGSECAPEPSLLAKPATPLPDL